MQSQHPSFGMESARARLYRSNHSQYVSCSILDCSKREVQQGFLLREFMKRKLIGLCHLKGSLSEFSWEQNCFLAVLLGMEGLGWGEEASSAVMCLSGFSFCGGFRSWLEHPSSLIMGRKAGRQRWRLHFCLLHFLFRTSFGSGRSFCRQQSDVRTLPLSMYTLLNARLLQRLSGHWSSKEGS